MTMVICLTYHGELANESALVCDLLPTRLQTSAGTIFLQRAWYYSARLHCCNAFTTIFSGFSWNFAL
jgi:hypothetical protein